MEILFRSVLSFLWLLIMAYYGCKKYKDMLILCLKYVFQKINSFLTTVEIKRISH